MRREPGFRMVGLHFALPLTPPSLAWVLSAFCVLSSKHGHRHGFQQSASNLSSKPLSLIAPIGELWFHTTRFHLSAFLCTFGRLTLFTSSAISCPLLFDRPQNRSYPCPITGFTPHPTSGAPKGAPGNISRVHPLVPVTRWNLSKSYQSSGGDNTWPICHHAYGERGGRAPRELDIGLSYGKRIFREHDPFSPRTSQYLCGRSST